MEMSNRAGLRLDSQLMGDLAVLHAISRQGSMSAAATALNITQGAVSQRISRLEKRLGQMLLVRSSRGANLTDPALTLMEAYEEAARTLSLALDTLRGDKEQFLRIVCPPSLATYWLSPKLDDFLKANPGVDVSLYADQRTVLPGDFNRDGIDIAIIFELDLPAGLVELACVDEMNVAIAQPGYEAAIAAGTHICLHDDTPWTGARDDAEWRAWSDHTGNTALDTAAAHRHYNLSSMAYQAAQSGGGVAMGRAVLLGESLAAKTLMIMSGDIASTPACYRLVCAAPMAGTPLVRRFAHWAKREMIESRQRALDAIKALT